MSDRVFLDTNVLVYAVDRDEPQKLERARDFLDGLLESESASRVVISTQVLQEFYVAVVRKIDSPMSEAEAEGNVRRLAELSVVGIDSSMVLAAITTSRSHQLSLWDALIVEAARFADCRRLVTEDLQHGMEFGSLRVENPFLGI